MVKTVFEEPVDGRWWDAISGGTKVIEGRLNKSWVLEAEKGDKIRFSRRNDQGEINHSMVVTVLITDKKEYVSFKQMFEKEGLENVLPGVNNHEEGEKVYRKWFSEEKEKNYGVIGLFLKVII